MVKMNSENEISLGCFYFELSFSSLSRADVMLAGAATVSQTAVVLVANSNQRKYSDYIRGNAHVEYVDPLSMARHHTCQQWTDRCTDRASAVYDR